jgi:hypothetical protein
VSPLHGARTRRSTSGTTSGLKWVWMSVGFGAGFVLGTRVGKERFDRFVHRSKGAADDMGLTSASERVMDSARSVGCRSS